MLRSYLATAGVVLVALTAFPSAAHANIFDVIWKMSGPQMIGVTLHCEFDPEETTAPAPKSTEPAYTNADCRVIDYKFTGNLAHRRFRTAWLSLDTGAYVSDGKDSGSNDYKCCKYKMLMFEPMFEFRSKTVKDGNLSFHHGLLGLSYNVLFGGDSGTFDKAGLKFRPIGVTYKKVNFSYVLRVYPNGFTADEFIGTRIDSLSRGAEALHSITFGYIWR